MVPELAKSALTIEAGSGHLFALPWRGHTLLATTDTEFTGDPATVGVTETDIDTFLATFRKYLPAAALPRENVEFFYAGLRPLVSDGAAKTGADSYNVSRRAELVDHGKEGLMDGLFSALGGKYTTSRDLAQNITDALVKKLDRKTPRCATAKTPLPGGRFDRFDDMLRGYQKTWPGSPPCATWPICWAPGCPQALKGARIADLVPLNQSGDTQAQIAFALKEEMALTLEDVVMRRTGLGQFGRPAREVLEKAANQMAAHLGWDDSKKATEIAGIERLYQVQS